MTSNQINYWTLQEGKRHNVASEVETGRANLAREHENYRHNLASETETNRHNVETEKYNIAMLNETQMHNRNTEATAAYSANQQAKYQNALAEIQRQKQQNDNFYNLSKLAEESRHNQAYESYQAAQLQETTRSNKAQESIARQNVAVASARQRADAAYQSAMSRLQQTRDLYGNQLTEREISQIDAKIYDLRFQHAKAEKENTINSWNAFWNTANNLIRSVGSLIGLSSRMRG